MAGQDLNDPAVVKKLQEKMLGPKSERVHHGSCHCGAVRFRVTGEFGLLVTGNCSMCRRTGFINWYVEPGQFALETPEIAFDDYRFGSQIAKNFHCKVCGVAPFRRPRSVPHLVAVNVRCLDGVEVFDLAVQQLNCAAIRLE